MAHLLINVFWYTPPQPGLKSYCGHPVEVRSRFIYEIEGQSSFIQCVHRNLLNAQELYETKRLYLFA